MSTPPPIEADPSADIHPPAPPSASQSAAGAGAGAAATSAAAPQRPRFDRKFIEEHRLLERYFEGKLPYKGARDLEAWCRVNPEYLAELQLAERTQASLRLLEACGQPQDLSDKPPPWWRRPQALVALAVIAVLSLFAFWVLFAKYQLLRSELADARLRAQQGALVQPSAETQVSVVPDADERAGQAVVRVDHASPQLVELHLDLDHSKYPRYRLVVDKRDQGRVLILNDVEKDSNGELRATFNTSALSAGSYVLRIEALPFQGSPLPVGWVVIEAR